MLAVLQRIVHKGDVAFDIGANIGLYSRFLVQRFQASQVYAFEPMPDNRDLLAENLKIGDCAAHVQILPYAVSNRDAVCEFQIDNLTSNSGTLDDVTGGKPSQSRHQYGLQPISIQVKAVRLDSLIEGNDLPKPDVMKIDVEGAEGLALEGAKSLLQQHSPRLIIELHSADCAVRVLHILWSLGYHCFGPLEKEGTVTYQQVTADDLRYVTGQYSLHFLAASRDLSDLAPPLTEFIA